MGGASSQSLAWGKKQILGACAAASLEPRENGLVLLIGKKALHLERAWKSCGVPVESS